ncbi:hypothetical protein MVES_002053 [Malassezia vespertilionis]|uniref:U3 small nucleolar RNA-associated protein 11 n=2 Tax=Malassezia vespertilionis TaxID=2020962 RepID=A0A2N1JBW0_9BASI|nr:hypothetical protein MVES_002053 [Malassezia vespertilionis]
MGMRDFVHRRNHKERSQPENRKRYGLLEKHKDYVERARDHHVKRDKLKRLRQKAAERNTDEFYTGMLGTKTQKGVHLASRGNTALDNETVSLLKTQDAGYLRKQLVSERKRYELLVEEIAPRIAGMRMEWLKQKPLYFAALKRADLLGNMENAAQRRVEGLGKKTLWVDTVDEMQRHAKVAKKSASSKAREAAVPTTAEEKTGERQLGLKLRELATRQRRLDALNEASSKLDTVRALMNTRSSHAVRTKQINTLKDAVAKDGTKRTVR